MEDIIYSSALIFSALAWGYFDLVTNICFRLKMEIYDKKQTKKLNEEKMNRQEMATFFENDDDFKRSSFIKISSFIIAFISAFYMPLNDVLIIGFGFFVGRLIPTKTGFFEHLSGTEKPKESCSKSLLYSNIYFVYFTIYLISVILNS